MQGTGRWIGIDLSKRTYELRYFDQKGTVGGTGGLTGIEGRRKLYAKLTAADIVAIEACSLAFVMEKEMRSIGCQVVILNPSSLAVIYASTKKTDKEDALKLARMIKVYEKEDLPIVNPPSDTEMYQRKLVSEYAVLKRDRTREINRLHALFLQCGITDIKKADLSTALHRAAVFERLTGYEAEQGQRLCRRLELIEGQIQVLDEKIKIACKEDDNIQRAKTIPGVGDKTALAFSAYVGDGSRFSNAKQVANYVGLVPRVDSSGTINRYGSITKKGNAYVRSLLYQAAWAVVRSSNGGPLKQKFLYMSAEGKSKKKSITAIARKMAELLYTVIKTKQIYTARPLCMNKAVCVRIHDRHYKERELSSRKTI